MNYKLYRTRRKNKWRGDLTETIGAYERLHLLELRARAVHINSRKDGEKPKIYERFPPAPSACTYQPCGSRFCS